MAEPELVRLLEELERTERAVLELLELRANLIRQATAAGGSLREVAAAAGLSHSTVYRLLEGDQ